MKTLISLSSLHFGLQVKAASEGSKDECRGWWKTAVRMTVSAQSDARLASDTMARGKGHVMPGSRVE